jgi:hypothetical protein
MEEFQENQGIPGEPVISTITPESYLTKNSGVIPHKV